MQFFETRARVGRESSRTEGESRKVSEGRLRARRVLDGAAAEDDSPLTNRHVRTDGDEIRIVEEEFALRDGARVRAETARCGAAVTRVLVDANDAARVARGDGGARVRAVAARHIGGSGRRRDDPLDGPSDDGGPREPIDVSQVMREFRLRARRHFPKQELVV